MFAVIFDMDGLMLDTERVARSAWLNAMADEGFLIEDSTFQQIVGRTVRDAQDVMANVYGDDFPFEHIYRLRQMYYNADLTENGVPLKPGLLELLDALEAYGVQKAVGSSTSRHFAQIKLSGAGIIDRFQAIVCGDEVPNGKPAPDIFLAAARLLAVDIDRCMVLEDSEAGIRAAYAAGALPVMIPDDGLPPTPDVARLTYRVLPSLFDVIPLLAEFRANGFPSLDAYRK